MLTYILESYNFKPYIFILTLIAKFYNPNPKSFEKNLPRFWYHYLMRAPWIFGNSIHVKLWPHNRCQVNTQRLTGWHFHICLKRPPLLQGDPLNSMVHFVQPNNSNDRIFLCIQILAFILEALNQRRLNTSKNILVHEIAWEPIGCFNSTLKIIPKNTYTNPISWRKLLIYIILNSFIELFSVLQST
jgi:hypothetical protein